MGGTGGRGPTRQIVLPTSSATSKAAGLVNEQVEDLLPAATQHQRPPIVGDGAVGPTRQIVLPTSSATSKAAPCLSIATPTGRPRASSRSVRNPVSTTTGSPDGRPLANGTNSTL
jgi:hypothetical protein